MWVCVYVFLCQLLQFVFPFHFVSMTLLISDFFRIFMHVTIALTPHFVLLPLWHRSAICWSNRSFNYGCCTCVWKRIIFFSPFSLSVSGSHNKWLFVIIFLQHKAKWDPTSHRRCPSGRLVSGFISSFFREIFVGFAPSSLERSDKADNCRHQHNNCLLL